MSQEKSKLAFNETPIVFPPTLAVKLGLNEAIVFQTLYFAHMNPRMGKVDENGIKWTRFTVDEFHDRLPFYDEGIIKRTIKNLVNDGLLYTRTFTGRSNWYRPNHERLEQIDETSERLTGLRQKRQLARSARVKVQNVPLEVSVQNVPTNGTNCTASKIVSKTTKNLSKNNTTTATKNVALENEENLDQLQNEVSENNSTLPIQEKPTNSQTTQPNENTSKVKVQTPPQVAAHHPIDPLVVAYCEALTLNHLEDTAKKEAETFVKKLLIVYPHTTAMELKANVIHAVEVQSLKVGQILKNWAKLSNDIALANSSEIRAIVASLKGIYGVSDMSRKQEWHFVEIAGQIKSMRITASEVAKFKAIWPDNFMMPKLENFIASLTQNMSKIKGDSNNGHASATSNGSGNNVGELSQSVFNRLAAKSN